MTRHEQQSPHKPCPGLVSSIIMTSTAVSQQHQYAQAPADAAPGPILIDTQHEDLVHDAQMDYYGSKLATCSSGAFCDVCLFLPLDCLKQVGPV